MKEDQDNLDEYDIVYWDENNVNPYLSVIPSLAINVQPELYDIYRKVSNLYEDIYSISKIIKEDSNAVLLANQDNYNLFEKFNIVKQIFNDILENLDVMNKEILSQTAQTFFKIKKEFVDFLNKKMGFSRVYIRDYGLHY
jgi:hypothetical protein